MRSGRAALVYVRRNYCHPGRKPARSEVRWVKGSRKVTLKLSPQDPSTSLGMTANLSAMDLLLATHNQHKTREFAQLLGPNFTLRDLTNQSDLPEILETGRTFEENAVIKATAISKIFSHEMVIADDSGLEVDALDGAPGVFSARYAGENVSDRRNVEKLLRELQDAPERSAQFRCVIAVAKNGEVMTTVGGEVAGTITKSPRGENGFGYDPIFMSEGFEKTFAELPGETKNAISHRAKAVADLVRYFNTARPSA